MIPSNVIHLGERPCSRVATFLVVAIGLLFPLANLNAQAPRRVSVTTPPEEESNLFKDYRGVQLGMTADEVRKKLGDPRDKGEEQDFFMFNDTETVQIVYDKTHKVITISADFMTTGSSVPTPKQVFGTEVEPKSDGSVYRMVRFPKAGYWVSYNRTSGDAPLTTVTLQKIQ